MKMFTIKLINDNGAKTGCGAMSIQVRALDRRTAQTMAVAHAQKIGGPESKWRLHDNERGKA